MEVANWLVMSDPAALLLRCPKVSIHDLHLNLMFVDVICAQQTQNSDVIVTT